MPTYVYRCRKCKHRYELFHGITDDTVKRCPRCRGKAERVPAGGAGILFKGSGFYITDYRSTSYKDKARQEKTGGSPAGSAGGAKAGGSGGGAAAPAGGKTPAAPGGKSSGTRGGSSTPSSGGD